MLDRDLAQLYCVKPFRLREQVKRHNKRFPENYMFQLTQSEVIDMVSQNAIPTKRHLGGSLPYAFTEHGTLMLASILNSRIAIEINRKIIEAFVELRNHISTIPEYTLLNERVRRIESEVESIKTHQKFEGKLVESKLMHISRETNKFSKILDEFQENCLIIKRQRGDEIFEG
jgi:hypothetical protein